MDINFGFGPNDNNNLLNAMINNMNNLNINLNNNINNNLNNNLNNNNGPFGNFNNMNNLFPHFLMNNNMNMNMWNNNFWMGMNPMIRMNNSEPIPYDPNIKRNEGLDVKCDIDRILQSNKDIEVKNKDIQTILNYIPYTILQDEPKKLKDEPRCVICLSDFEIGEKVSALPCCHSFHTKCLDDWIKRNPKCPVCKFEVTRKFLLGEDFIKEHLKKIEEMKKEKERIEREKREKELKEKKEKELKEKKEKELKEKREKELKDKKRKKSTVKKGKKNTKK